jgi:type 1 glutamine amidotransferase
MKSIPANPVRRFVLVTVTLLSFYCANAQQRLLVFSKTAGYRHSSITNGISAIQQIGASNGFEVVTTENAGDFNANYLAGFNAVVFLSTTGDVLDNNQQAAFEQYIKSGGGYVGVHAATDCEYSWPWYGQLVGAWFNGHPDIQPATLNVINTTHPSTASLPASWQRTDEWYNFGNFQSPVNTLIRIDENSYTGGTMGNNHPIAWYHDFDGGRSWYTALGHTDASFSEASFLSHLAGGINYALGSATLNTAPTADAGADQTITLPVNTVSLNGSGADQDGTVVSYAWTKLSGPSGGNISSANTAATEITNLQEGVYIFRLTVGDNGGASASNDVQITVNAAVISPNIKPDANAGVDISITLPDNSVTLNGNGTDSDGTISAYAWTKVSGPATGGGTIVNASGSSTDITGLNEGTYIFRLTVTDNDGDSGTDEVTVIINPAPPPPNLDPVANAGADRTITLPINTTTFSGSGKDDDGNIIKYNWSKVSGPATGGGTIQSPNSPVTNINSLNEGTYVYRLTVTDNNNATATDEVQVKVNTVALPNEIPKAFAGADKEITLPVNTVTLTGSGSDADGVLVSYNWLKISGPSAGGGTIQKPADATTNILNLKEGTYIFRFIVTDDNGAKAYDEMKIKVNPSASSTNIAPVAEAGEDLTITLPASTVTLNGSKSSDADGSIQSWEWKKMSGPAAGLLSGGNTSKLQLSALAAGEYDFRLIVTDNFGASDTDDVKLVVLVPNELPVINLKDTFYVTLPVRNTLLDASNSNDPDGTISKAKWTFVKGPSKPFMMSPDSIATIVTELVAGVYDFNISITDDRGAVVKGNTTVVVKNSGTRKIIPKMGLYPNPAQQSATLTIDAEIDGRADVTIYDLHGRPVQYNTFTKSGQVLQARLSLNNLAKGIYMVEVIIERAEKVVLKLVRH